MIIDGKQRTTASQPAGFFLVGDMGVGKDRDHRDRVGVVIGAKDVVLAKVAGQLTGVIFDAGARCAERIKLDARDTAAL